MTVWQIAAGGNQREFHDLFLKHGIAFVGGDKQIKSLMQIQKGDIIALKRGLSEVVAVGQVVERNGEYNGIGGKDWLRHLDGWSLEAYVNVDWRTLSSGLNLGTVRNRLTALKMSSKVETAEKDGRSNRYRYVA